MKKIRVKYRKLGRESAHGLAWDNRVIELDQRLHSKKHLRVLIHECLHLQNPEWSETKVDIHSKELADILWSQNYRRIDVKPHP